MRFASRYRKAVRTLMPSARATATARLRVRSLGARSGSDFWAPSAARGWLAEFNRLSDGTKSARPRTRFASLRRFTADRLSNLPQHSLFHRPTQEIARPI